MYLHIYIYIYLFIYISNKYSQRLLLGVMEEQNAVRNN